MNNDPVRATTKIKVTATDQKAGMTVGELQAFTAACARADVAVNEPVKIRSGYAGQIRWIEVEG